MGSLIAKGVTNGPSSADVTGISDLDLVQVSGVWHLYVTTRAYAGLTSYELDALGGLSFEDRQTVFVTASFPPSQTEFLTLQGISVAVSLGRSYTAFETHALSSSGSFGAGPPLLANSGPTNSFTALTEISFGQTQLLAAVRFAHDGILIYETDPALGLTLLAEIELTTISPTYLASSAISDKHFVVVGTDNRVMTYQLWVDGSVGQTFDGGSLTGLGISGISQLETVVLDGVNYVIVASVQSGSLSVLRLTETGQLQATDHVIDDQNTRFDHVQEMQTFTQSGRVFVVAAGSDDGFSLFELLPNGRLFHHATAIDGLNTTLNNVSGMELFVHDGIVHVYASSETEPGITHFEFAVGTLGQVSDGTIQDDVILGTSDADILYAHVGNDQLFGGAGQDVLVDGSGEDTLYGGGGADTFVIGLDGVTDQISDFQTGIDRIDLSTFEMLRSTDQLLVQTTADGATLTYAGEVLIVQSLNGQSLDLPMLGGDGLITLTHVYTETRANDLPPEIDIPPASTNNPPLYDFAMTAGREGSGSGAHIKKTFVAVEIWNDLRVGGAGNDTLNGGLGRDTLDGRGGDDVLTGGVEADTFVFSAGADAITDFELGTDRIELASGVLQTPHQNAAEVIENYATLMDDRIVLNFGEGNSLILHDVTDINALAQDLAYDPFTQF